uniref:Alpha-mannosidase n=1 Tax=Strongyloides papillosus TaxID=174720 RepID=A0A0N5CCI8_STREA
MLKVYSNIPFQNAYQIERKHYYDVSYDVKDKRDMRKINVFLIPHSHDDPGWLKTFEEYYNEDVSGILNGMLDYLSKKNEMKFVYVEMSFFELFYSSISPMKRRKVKKLLKDNKLEILSGGWVMTDEANSHFVTQIIELFEGHEFLKNNLQYIPRNHWSIDPFGLSPTMAYLIKESGFRRMAIQRVHYLVKQYFAQRKLFEFKWRQLWSGGYQNDSAKTDMFTHIFPYTGYTTRETCGPDMGICEMFDFREPYASVMETDKKTLKNAARDIVDQFRKKALIFRGSNIFVPLGSDFSFSQKYEWKNVYENYKLIINEINNDPQYNMKVQFGTLDDYFRANDENIIEENINIPVISGDFFTYADREEDYWSGYYTSRPFYKRFDRVLMDHLRSAEIIFASVLGKTRGDETRIFLKTVDYNKLVYARRAISLFQHHDGVTGTARDHVVIDYGKKLFKAIENCYSIIEKSLQFDMTRSLAYNKKIMILAKIHKPDKMTRIKKFNTINNLLIFNPHTSKIDREVICVKIGGQKIYIIEGIDINDQEVHPTIKKKDGKLIITNRSYKLCFITSLEALEVKTFKLINPEETGVEPNIAKIYTSSKSIVTSVIFDKYKHLRYNLEDRYFTVSEAHGLQINKKTGYVVAIKNSPVSITYEHYVDEKYYRNSGAYLFHPDGPSKPLNTSGNSYIISKGKLHQKVVINGNENFKLIHSIDCMVTSPHYVDVTNIIDIKKKLEIEVAMKIRTKIKGIEGMIRNRNVFFTDLNGYQIIKRKRLRNLPIQGNFYPMPSTIYIEDRRKRLTLLGNQPLGCSSQEEGSVEVILDRRHFMDDLRGLEQGVTDNLATRSRFRILIENNYKIRDEKRRRVDDYSVTGYLSSRAFQANQKLHYNIIQMQITKDITDMNYRLSILKRDLPHNIHLVTLRTLTQPENYGRGGKADYGYVRVKRKALRSAAMILQNIAYDESIGETDYKLRIKNGELYMNNYFSSDFITSYQKTSLTMLHESNNITHNGYVDIKPMELKTLKVDFA